MKTPRKPQHPEAPKDGEEVMYVDLNRDRLEKLYKNSQDKKMTQNINWFNVLIDLYIIYWGYNFGRNKEE